MVMRCRQSTENSNPFQSPSHRGTFSNVAIKDPIQGAYHRFNPLHLGALSRMRNIPRAHSRLAPFQSPSHRGTFSNKRPRSRPTAGAITFQSPSHRGTFSNRLTILRAL